MARITVSLQSPKDRPAANAGVGKIVSIASCCVALMLVSNASAAELPGQYVRIVTDAPGVDREAQLVEVFDAAVPQFAARLGIEPSAYADFHITAYVFTNHEAMRTAQVIPADLPDFRYGIQRGNKVWVVRQISPYASRHLLLHEEVHALMHAALGGTGAGWFTEGTAEFLATHEWQGGTLRVGVLPSSRDMLPFWGRIRLLQEARARQEVPSLEQVMKYTSDPQADLTNYAWSWALLAMLDAYPEYREAWTEALRRVNLSSEPFNQTFYDSLREEWEELRQRWRVWAWEVDYGYQIPELLLERVPREAWNGQPRLIEVDATRGWQPALSGLRAGTTLRVAASGEVILDQQPRPWTSQPAGITIDYHAGAPLGRLQALLLDSPAAEGGWCRPLKTFDLGAAATLRLEQGGVLMLRVNDYPHHRRENQGKYSVQITR